MVHRIERNKTLSQFKVIISPTNAIFLIFLQNSKTSLQDYLSITITEK